MEPQGLKILLVEDNPDFGVDVSSLLELQGCDVTHCFDGDKAFEVFCNHRFNFCIIDLMLPGIDGFTLTERVRNRDAQIPVVIISKRAHKDDKQKAFNLGVDDYMVKPFDGDELVWRVKAIARRMHWNSFDFNCREKLVQVGNLTFDFNNQVLLHGNKAQRLTRRECEVFRMLCKQINHVVKRDDLLLHLWGDVDYFHGRSLDVFISKLRRYIKADGRLKITNIPTVGYILEQP
jgi:DNA-binding response OmpR family regulator